MKTIAVLVLMLMLSVGASAADKKADVKAAQESGHHAAMMSDSSHAMISVPTVLCDNCVKTVTEALKKLDGVDSVRIDLGKKIAHVNFNGKKVKVIDIKKAIAAAGYDADDIKRDEKAYAKLPKCCQSERQKTK
jgi:copper chaperone CopZ